MVPTAETYDLVVIGGGPAGYATALYGASAGLSVALAERDRVGGTCLHRGCIPAKELLETAAVWRTVHHAGEFGITVPGPATLDMGTVQARKQRIIDNLTKGLSGLLKGRKVTVLAGTGSLGPNRQVTVRGQDGSTTVVEGRTVVLAAGSVPRSIPGFDVDGRVVMTSDEVLALDHLPASVAVIGGGAIGCEFASMLADLGSKVTILEALPRILAGCDADVSSIVGRSFTRRGIDVRAGVAVAGHDPQPGGGTVVRFGDEELLEVECVVVSVGRRPLGADLGLEGTAVAVDDRGFVVVDEFLRTAEPGVYACGDLVATPALAHVGFIEGINVVKHALGEVVVPLDAGGVPWCIYCHPEVAYAGLTEEAARAAGHEVVVSKHRFAGNGRAMIVGETEGLVKVVAERRADGTGGRILGVHLVGPWVTEQLGQGYLAVNWEATVDEVAAFIQPHPTLSELFGETVLSLTGRSLHG